MMRRSRVSEMPQRPSLRAPQRTSSSESDGSHSSITKRSPADRNSKLGDRCSPRNPVIEKKLRTRITDLESQLGQVQKELKKFKEQLTLSETDKRKEAQAQVKKTNKKHPAEVALHNRTEKSLLPKSPQKTAISEGNPETGAEFLEVSLITDPAESGIVPTHLPNNESPECKPVERCSEQEKAENKEPMEPFSPQQNMGQLDLKAILAEKNREIEDVCAENSKLKQQASEAAAKASMSLAKEEETALKLSGIGMELQETKAEATRVAEELRAAVEAKAALETEMTRLRVQTEQWKKAASEAAAVLAGEVDAGGPKVAAQNVSSLGKHVGFELAGHGVFDSAEDFEEGVEGGKRKGPGMRMFGDLWKRRGQK